MTISAQIRNQLIQALNLDLVGPTPDVLAQLALQGRTEEATELRGEVLDRPPNRWYQTGFLTPSETSLGERADDAADDEFAGLDGQNLSAKRKSNASGDDTGASEAGPARRVFFTCSVALSLLIPTRHRAGGHGAVGQLQAHGPARRQQGRRSLVSRTPHRAAQHPSRMAGAQWPIGPGQAGARQ